MDEKGGGLENRWVGEERLGKWEVGLRNVGKKRRLRSEEN